MTNEKIEIEIQPKSNYYFNSIKKKIGSIITLVMVLFIFIGAIYIGYYILLFIILLAGFNYFIKTIRK